MKKIIYIGKNDVENREYRSFLCKTNINFNCLITIEKIMLFISVIFIIINFILFIYRSVSLDWVTYGIMMAIVCLFLTTGFFYRLSGRSDRIGTTLICTALFTLFAYCIFIFNYLLTPLWREPIDVSLNAIDQIFGYHWPAVIKWSGQHPVFNEIVRFAYASTILQFSIIVVILGMSGQAKELHILVISMTFTAVFTVCFWGIFPSLGAKSLYDLPYAMESLASPEVDTFYGEQLRILAQKGSDVMNLRELRGLVAFPSYHIIKACIMIYSMRNVGWAFPVFLVLNALIFPGIFMHGGHHMVDLPAGVIVAVGGIYLARKLVSSQYRKSGLPEFLEK